MSIKSRWFYHFLFLGTVLLLLILSQQFAFAEGYDDKKFGAVCDSTLKYLYGGFGALISAIAGVAAIVASALGGFRMAWALLVVSIGSFILQSYTEIWFGADACK